MLRKVETLINHCLKTASLGDRDLLAMSLFVFYRRRSVQFHLDVSVLKEDLAIFYIKKARGSVWKEKPRKHVAVHGKKVT